MHRRFTMHRAVGLAAFVGWTSGAAVWAQAPGEQKPAIVLPPVGVEFVRVDVVVTDKGGQPRSGLVREDFAVFEDGQLQTLAQFEAYGRRLPGAPPAPSAPAVAVSAGEPARPRPPRYVVLAVDDFHIEFGNLARAQKALTRFVEEDVGPEDRVALETMSGAVSQEFTTDRAVLRQAISRITPRASGGWMGVPHISEYQAELIERGDQDALAVAVDEIVRERPFDPDPETEARQKARAVFEESVFNARATLETLENLIRNMARLPGRKLLFLLSDGFLVGLSAQGGLGYDVRSITDAGTRAGVVVYSLETRGLGAQTHSGGLMAASTRRDGMTDAKTYSTVFAMERQGEEATRDGIHALAADTGGFLVQNKSDLHAGLKRMLDDTETYYVLAYEPTNTKRDGAFRRIEVRLPGLRDVKVRARKGYFAPGEKPPSRSAAKPGADPELERALASAVPEREIPVSLAAFTLQPVDEGRVRVRLVAELGLKPALFAKEPDGSLSATLDVAMALNHVKGAGRQRTPWNERKVKVPAQAEGLEIQVPFEGAFDLPGGACQAKLVVRERASRALGSVVHNFEVPDPGSWRVSTPILSDMPGEERGSAPRLRVSRSFVAGAPLYCYLEVYDAPTKAAAAPRVSLAYTLVDAQGKTRKTQAASPLTLGPTGIPTRLETIPLSGLSPGPYELRLSVRDEASGRAQEFREPFVVRRPKSPDLAIYLELLRAFQAGEVARASSGVMEWRPQDLEELAASLPREDTALRRAALLLHTALAIRLWSNARSAEANAQIGIGRAVLGKDSPPELHRDWLLSLGYRHLTAATPAKALPFFEECARLFPAAADAWLGAGMCHELIAFPDGFAPAELPSQDAAQKAERCYREAARLDPRLAEARLRLGRVLSKTGILDEAEKELAAAMETSAEGPLTAFAQVFWGGVRDARGDLAGAVSHYEAALAADQESETAAFALSEALYRSGRHRRAAEILASALSASRSTEISPWHAYHLAFSRRDALFAPPQETAPIAVGQTPGGTP